jgi:hypothetical protein
MKDSAFNLAVTDEKSPKKAGSVARSFKISAFDARENQT